MSLEYWRITGVILVLWGYLAIAQSPKDDSQFTDLSKFDGTFRSYLALDSLLHEADQSQLRNYMNEAEQINPRSIRKEAQQQIMFRFSALDPIAALRFVDSYIEAKQFELRAAVLIEWSINDISALVDYVEDQDFTTRCIALRSIVRARGDLEPDELRRIAESLQLHNELDTYLSNPNKNQPIDRDAQFVWDTIIQDEIPNRFQSVLLRSVARDLWDEYGKIIVAGIASEKLDWFSRKTVLEDLLTEHVEINPTEAFDLAQSVIPRMGETLIFSVVQQWANTHPQEALQAVSGYSSLETRSNLQEEVITSWAWKNPQTLLNQLDTLPEQFYSSAISRAINSLTNYAPDIAVQYLNLLTEEARRDLAVRIAGRWAYQDSEGALDWALSNEEQTDLRHELLRSILPFVASTNSARAFDVALEQPLDDSGFGLESVVIDQLCRVDVDRAIALLSKVREGSTKLSAYLSVARALLPEQPFKATALVDDLTGDQQTRFLGLIASIWLAYKPEQVYSSLTQFKAGHVRSTFALELLIHHIDFNTLTEEQVERATEFLSEQDIEALKNYEDDPDIIDW